MDQFQLVLGDNEAGPVRASWDEAAQDAVSAGLAVWVWGHAPNSRAIEWTTAQGRVAIRRILSHAEI